MKYLFIVQGEGRGHMTQALSLAHMLRQSNHQVCRVIVGKSKRRNLPAFFVDQIGAPIEHLASPNFETDKNQKSVKPVKTVIKSILQTKKFRKSIKAIHKIVKEDEPDVIINFYDFLGGIYNFIKKPKAKFVCIAHQFLLAHPEFDFPSGRKLDKASLKLGNKVASMGADKILCLSFQYFEDFPKKKLFVVPPLLREEIKSLEISNEGHILAYMVNPGYGEEVEHFHKEKPDQPLHCFWDMKDRPEEYVADDTLTFHQLNDKKFLQKMASAKGYITTAGFESVCEAMYMGKPVLMVPVEGHYEQACNAIDAMKAGAGISSDQFEISKLIDYIPTYKDTSGWFRKWADEAPKYFIKHLS
ncbi:glycosyltransferase family protein [Marinoscillum sp. MHG1-6]|uniref:glycosyltransferase family protein n=1 Tax=Marinoscillum sp. MHG1-6 TaxID=2959627 RepID=UPI0021581EF6|nr:glycosyltransferase family protein [Marinoscillum sp. MHG1-6]